MYLYVLYIYGASKPKPYLILIGGCFMYYKKMFYNKIAYSKTKTKSILEFLEGSLPWSSESFLQSVLYFEDLLK